MRGYSLLGLTPELCTSLEKRKHIAVFLAIEMLNPPSCFFLPDFCFLVVSRL